MSELQSLPITHRSFVNTWECDENAHWNVQFYFRAFQQASEILPLQHGKPNPGAATAQTRHIRYHRELAAATSVRVRSGVIADGDLKGLIVHRLDDSQSGILAATALDLPAYDPEGLPSVQAEDTEEARPRGVPAGPKKPEDTTPLLKDGTAFESHYSTTTAAETDSSGEVSANALCSRLTDSAPHVWDHIGITGEWLSGNNCGRVAVEFAMTRLAPIRAGTGLVLVSWVPVVEEKTMMLQHQFEDLVTRQPLAVAQVRALVMDLSQRRAVPVPEFVRRTAT